MGSSSLFLATSFPTWFSPFDHIHGQRVLPCSLTLDFFMWHALANGVLVKTN